MEKHKESHDGKRYLFIRLVIVYILLVFQKKVDNRRSTGAGGGMNCQLNEIDNLVLSIIGRDSAVIDGLPVEETAMPVQDIFTDENGTTIERLGEENPTYVPQCASSNVTLREKKAGIGFYNFL